MRFYLLLLLVVVAEAAPLVLQRNRKLFKTVRTFGDSLSDDGTGAWLVSNKTWPADPHYYGHRFSNGRVYAEVLAKSLHLKYEGFAVGGATTNDKTVQGYTGPGSTIPSPSILDQISRFLRRGRNRKESLSDSLFIVYGGANDAFFGLPNVTAAEVVDNLKLAVTKLKAHGGQRFLLPTLPPLGRNYPFVALTPSYAGPLGDFSVRHRAALLEFARSDPSVLVVDMFTLYTSFFGDPAKYGFDPTKLDQSCLRGVYMEVPGGVTVCDNPDEYVWWDDYHPTKKVHQLMAQTAVKAIKAKGWAP